MCMCPGRNKQKATYAWKRDLQTDLQGMCIIASDYSSSPFFSLSLSLSAHCIQSVISDMVERVDLGQRLVIHCNGGKGRTGLVACAILVAKGMSPDHAIHAIRARRKGMIRNPAQIFYLKVFETRWRGEVANAAKPRGSIDAGSTVHARAGVVTLRVVETKGFEEGGIVESIEVVAVSGPSLRDHASVRTWHPSMSFAVTDCARWFCTIALFGHQRCCVVALASISGDHVSHTEPAWVQCNLPDGSGPTPYSLKLTYLVQDAKAPY
jgi:hypothetical protein